jgi:predicted protein tyrosine phosphatase
MYKITEEIFTSGKASKLALAQDKIKYCINVSGIPVDYKVDDVCPIADDFEKNDPNHVVKICELIDRQVKAKNTPILIMCHAGMSRSPIIVALYLFYNHTFPSFDESLEYVIKRNEIAKPNPKLVDFITARVIPLMSIRGPKRTYLR